ncbi:MAG: uL15 family ribosomal protein [Patescibacteria group bacterium]|mgnify:CR=1 FL=1
MLHNLSSIQKRAQRVGRGGKRGTTSGRGTKGQKSRSGRRIRPAERDLIIRIPKRRGLGKSGPNKPTSPASKIFNLKDLSLVIKVHAKKGEFTLDKKFLLEAGLLPRRFSGDVKILGEGEMGMPIRVEGLKVSKSAKAKIERAGGRVISE